MPAWPWPRVAQPTHTKVDLTSLPHCPPSLPPRDLCYLSWRHSSLSGGFQMVEEWVGGCRLQVGECDADRRRMCNRGWSACFPVDVCLYTLFRLLFCPIAYNIECCRCVCLFWRFIVSLHNSPYFMNDDDSNNGWWLIIYIQTRRVKASRYML